MNAATELQKFPAGHAEHHLQDKRLMQPIETEAHSSPLTLADSGDLEEAYVKFFGDNPKRSGPALTDETITRAQMNLGVRLPGTYIEVLRERNGGVPTRRCFRTIRRTSWAEDHIEISAILGIGFDRGIHGELGSAYLVQEWDYLNIGIVICDTPSGSHDTVMLDYSECGPEGEPRVVYVDEDRSVLTLAPNFAEFARRLLDCENLQSSKG